LINQLLQVEIAFDSVVMVWSCEGVVSACGLSYYYHCLFYHYFNLIYFARLFKVIHLLAICMRKVNFIVVCALQCYNSKTIGESEGEQFK
jgi:hypothetical protein